MANYELAHRFHDGTGELASGAQVDENFDQAKERIEALEVLVAALQAAVAGGGANAWVLAGAALNKAETISPSRPALITFTIEAAGVAVSGQIVIGGKVVAKYNEVVTAKTLGEFYVNKGETWELHHEGGALSGATAATKIL